MTSNKVAHEYKRVYIDNRAFNGKTNFVTRNVDMLPAILHKHPLSGVQLAIFECICDKYDNINISNKKPISITYNEFAQYANCCNESAKKAIKTLIKHELILRVGDRCGRAKTKYVPNVDYIHALLKEHIEKS